MILTLPNILQISHAPTAKLAKEHQDKVNKKDEERKRKMNPIIPATH